MKQRISTVCLVLGLLVALWLQSETPQQTTEKGTATRQVATKQEAQGSPQSQSVFTGEHTDLSMGDTATWVEGLNIKLSDAHLAFQSSIQSGDAVVISVDMWNDSASRTFPFQGNWPCKAQDQNGVPLKSATPAPAVYKDRIFSTPLGPGQPRTANIGFLAPQSGNEVKVNCSLVYAAPAGQEEQPQAGVASWRINTAELEHRGNGS